MNLPTDYRVRAQALDPAGSFIVQAPAGSGKTELLIRRYLRLLARVSEPEEIIAITFTRKAASEMRTRVLQALDLARGPRPADRYESELWDIASEAGVANEQRKWRLERHPSRLRIQTIDSLCASVARQMPWVSGIGAPPRITEDARPLYEAAAVATVRWMLRDGGQWGDAIDRLLAHLDVRVPRTVDMLVDMLRFRDQWLRHISLRVDRDSDWRGRLQSVWQEQISWNLSMALEAIPRECAGDLVACAAYAGEELSRTNPDSAIAGWRDAAGLPGSVPEDLPMWKGLKELLLTVDGEWRRRVNVNNGFPAGKGYPAEMKKRMVAVLKSVAGNDRLKRELLRIDCLPGPAFDDRQWEILAALTSVLPMAAAQLQVLFAESGRVDFVEIGMRANHALGSFTVPGDLALRLDHRVSHLLVDEFQDTSVSHFQIIESLTGGWQQGDGRTVFLVGDPMQSIYRFREAEVGLFLRVRDRGMSNIDLKPLTLTENFRSRPAVVDWVNRVFGQCFPDASDSACGAVAYAHSTPHLPPVTESGVSVHALDDADPGGEGAMTAKLVREAWMANADERIAILVRSRQILRDILPALHAAGIDYAGIDIKRLDWEPAVQDLLSLARALADPADRVAWLAILRAPWCGLTLSDLYAIAGGQPGDCIWDCIRRDDITERLSADGRSRLSRIIGPLSEAIANRGRLPPWRSLENLWLSLGGPAGTGADAAANVRACLDLMREHAAQWGEDDLAGFVKLLSGYWAKSEQDPVQRLQIMTLHKAKGLEFDTVIIPGLNRKPRPGQARLLLWEEQMHLDDQTLLFAPTTELGSGKDPHYRYLSRLHTEKEHFETLRLLYVGCTRARGRLHLLASIPEDKKTGGLKAPGSSVLLSRLWPALAADFEDSARGRSGVEEPSPPMDRFVNRIAADWRLPELPPPATVGGEPPDRGAPETIEYSWVGETARHVGVIVHALLERIAREGLGQWSESRLNGLRGVWRTELESLGIAEQDASSASGQILEALLKVRRDERAEWLFSAGHRDARNEFAISWDRPDGVRHLRMDRTFVDCQGTRWIIDYKGSTHEGAGLEQFMDSEQQRYRGQLNDYARAMSAMAPGRIRLGLYFPMFAGWREWAFEDEK